MNTEKVKKIKDSQVWPMIESYLIEQINQVDNIDGLLELNNNEAGEEAKIREKTRQRLLKILEPFAIDERPEPSPQEIQNKKEQYGL